MKGTQLTFRWPRKTAVTAPVPNAIAPRTATELLNEFMELDYNDIRQMRKCMNVLMENELTVLQHRLDKIRTAIYEIRYERTDKGKALRAARKIKAKRLAVKKE